MQIPDFQHTVAQDTYYYAKMEERKHSKEIQEQSQMENQLGEFQTVSPCLMSEHSSDLQLLSPLLIATYILLLGWFHFLSAAFLGRYPTPLAPQYFGSPKQSRLHLHSSHNGFSGLPCRNTPDTYLASVAFLSYKGDSIDLYSILDSKARTTWLKLQSSAACRGWNMVLLFSYDLLTSCFR